MRADRARLYRDVDFLTSIYPYRNYKNPDSLKKASEYIQSEFKKSGFPISTQQWEVEGSVYENIIAHYRPEKKPRLIIGAHYDVYKNQPGADDNASSVAGLLELTRMIGKHKPEQDYGIDFAAFSLEEPPFFKKKEMGSYIHAQSLKGSEKDFMGMIAMEMIGYYEGKPGETDNHKELIVSGIRKFEVFSRKVSSLLRSSQLLGSRNVIFADDFKNNAPSDHRNYWPLDIPAVMIIGSGGNGNPNYHRKSDTIETLDFDTMKKAVESLAYMILNFSS